MLEKPSLILRVGIGKAVGFIVGLFAFLLLPIYGEVDFMFRLGFLFWLVIMGAMIGLFGVMTDYPLIKMPLPWWWRGSMIGGVMMLAFWLVTYERLNVIAINIFGEMSIFASGAWIIVDGILIGLLIAFVATKFGGEGKETVGR